MIYKWLKAGAVENGLLRRTTEGSPQGGVISPCLSNVFLQHALDEWFETEVRPRLNGDCTFVRFADEAPIALDNIVDAKRVLSVLCAVWTHPPPRSRSSRAARPDRDDRHGHDDRRRHASAGHWRSRWRVWASGEESSNWPSQYSCPRGLAPTPRGGV
ncbi:reverse transcriptase domain-containing protein [Bradyrhizobium sp. 164]|uniref:reverse transcriptase domain-containing protein n=1 Tax=Bradyrhizobium sp. 164 TaxID=2782637 RepID=UPI001FFA5ACC|nr:reverse transcriptase domain-containing protein [Bradyrhizobium sp. 164]